MHVLFGVLAVVVALGDAGGDEHPAALAAHARRDVEQPDRDHRLGAQPGLLAQFAVGQLGGLEVGPARRGALRELPAPQAERIPELLDEPEPVAVARDDQRIRRLVDDAVDAARTVGPAHLVLAHRHPVVAVHLAGRDALDLIHAPSMPTPVRVASLACCWPR